MKQTIKKIIITFLFGSVLYLASTFFLGAATVGGFIWEIVGALVVGGLAIGIGKKIANSDTWDEEEKKS